MVVKRLKNETCGIVQKLFKSQVCLAIIQVHYPILHNPTRYVATTSMNFRKFVALKGCV